MRRHWLIILLISLAIATYFIGRFSNLNILNAFRGKQISMTSQNEELSDQNLQLLAQISRLSTDVKVKELAMLEIQKSYASLIKENDTIRAEVDFYQNLLSSKDGSKTLRVFKLDVTREEGNLYKLKLVLAQKLEKARVLKGSIKMTLFGIQDNASKNIDISEKFKLQNTFEFKYYQVTKNTISLPEGFNPTELLVELYSKDNKPKNIAQRFQWQDILENDFDQQEQDNVQ